VESLLESEETSEVILESFEVSTERIAGVLGWEPINTVEVRVGRSVREG
jgi:hypothetical protein